MIEWLTNFASLPASMWEVLTTMAPYLLLGFFVAGLLSVLISPRLVERHLGGHGMWPVLKAAMFGVPLPLCSCGVIPVSASLRRHGASRGATIAFLVSTPQTGLDNVFVIYALLGPVVAIFSPIAALVSGVMGGLLVSIFDHREMSSVHLPQPADDKPACTDSCCAKEKKSNWLVRMLSYGFIDLPADIGKSLLIGVSVAALIAVVVPADFFTPESLKNYLGPAAGQFFGQGIGQMLLMLLLGIPMYVCATASVPMAMALIMKGVSPGAAWVFLMTGPATNAATIAMIWQLLGRRTALLYLLTIAASALACGFALDYIFHFTPEMNPAAHTHHMDSPGLFETLSAVALLAILVYGIIRARRAGKKELAPPAVPAAAGQTHRLRITGMTCSHCVASVKRALQETPGVASAEVDLASGMAVVQASNVDPEKLRDAVESLGYGVGPQDDPPPV